ncbi:MAG: hypothetical protein JOY59_05590, partial [Candidatus Eremiobacteraeota bacterium]|nr:hypothetical protein [Candidatus Eremiobacteraeota bacterium]
EHEGLLGWYEGGRRLDALIAIGEGKAAVDLIRRQVNIARTQSTPAPSAFLRLLVQYAETLEKTDAMAEAEFIWNEALDAIASAEIADEIAVQAYLRAGLLLVKMHNYDGAVAKLREAIRRAEELTAMDELSRQIVLADAWRGQSQAFEALGEFSQASNALDTLMNIKRHIRFIVFALGRS